MKILFLFFIIFKISLSYINIHPTFFDKPIDFGGSYQEFTLFNQSKDTVLYRIYCEPYEKDSNRDMSQWVNFYPRSITLAPGESGKIQVSIASNSKIETGEYSTILGIRELPLYEKVVAENSTGIGILTDLKLVINGYAGNISPKLIFSNLNLEVNPNKITLKGNVENRGERRGKFELYVDDYFLGNLRIHSKESLDLKDLEFNFVGNHKLKSKKNLIIIDYITKKTVGIIKL